MTGNEVNWCTISPTAGNGTSGRITVSVAENTGDDERRAVVQITRGTLKKSVIITQKYKNALLVSTNSIEVGKNGGTAAVEVQSNIDFKCTIPEQFSSWITEEHKVSNYYSFKVSANEDYEGREGYIIFSGDDLEETVYIKQAGGARLLLSESQQHVAADGGIVTLDVTSNCDFTVKIPDIDWIKQIDSRAMSSHTVYLDVQPNTKDGTPRSAEVVISSADGDISETFTITQHESDAIILSQNNITAKPRAATYQLSILSNIEVDYSISEGAEEWIKIVIDESRALSQQKLFVSVGTNAPDNFEQTTDSRQATITFLDKNNPDTNTQLTVSQDAAEIKVTKITPAQKIADADSHTMCFSMESNMNNLLFVAEGNFESFDRVNDVVQGEVPGSTDFYNYDVTLKVKQNLNLKDQESCLKVYCPKGWNETEKRFVIAVPILQAAPTLIATKEELTVTDANSTFTLPFEANLSYTLEVDDKEASWISFSEIDEKTHTYKATVQDNPLTESRSVTITARTNIEELTATCKITQAGIVLEPDVYVLTDDVRLSSLVDEETIHNTRSIKIVGPFMTRDYEIIYRMAFEGVLTSVDLSEARMKLEPYNRYKFTNINVYWGFYGPTYIENRMFLNSPINSLKLMENVDTIGMSAFSYSHITSLKLPASVTNLRINALDDMRLMKTLDMGDCTGLKKLPKNAVNNAIALENLILPPNLQEIGEHALSVSLDSDIKRSLKKVELPSSLKIISPLAFYGNGLEEVDIPAGVISIGKSAFNYNKSLKSAIIRGVTADKVIPEKLFFMCENLTHVEIAPGYKEIGWAAFSHTGYIENLVIPEGMTKIGQNAFSTSHITSITLPETLEYIGEQAFYQACRLEEITIPASVTTIGDSAFSCNFMGLSRIHLKMTEPPTLEGEIFYQDCDYRGRKLFVPKGCKEKYSSIEPWSRFPEIIEE